MGSRVPWQYLGLITAPHTHQTFSKYMLGKCFHPFSLVTYGLQIAWVVSSLPLHALV
jgi:hypothetical protein